MKKTKICKSGNGKAINFDGCGKELPVEMYDKSNFKYGLGLSCGCYQKWLLNTKEGIKALNNSRIKAKKEIVTAKKRDLREKRRELNNGNSMQLADTYFSRYIRLKHSIDGECTCYTCGTIKPIKEVDNGHYMKRTHKNTRYHEDNCRPQCKVCNGDTLHNGKQIEFRENLVNEIGEDQVNEIEALSRVAIKADYQFYKQKADYYREAVKELQKKLHIKIW